MVRLEQPGIKILEKAPNEIVSSLDKPHVHKEAAEQKKDLNPFYKAIDSISDKEKKELIKKLIGWHGNNNYAAARIAGLTEVQNSADSYKRHALLSSLFLKKTGDKSYEVDFQSDFPPGSGAGEILERYVGLGDLLHPSIRRVLVRKDGYEVDAVRARNPATGRIGYYSVEALNQGHFEYVPIFTGDGILDITGTVDEIVGQRYALAEHFANYKLHSNEATEEVEAHPNESYAEEAGRAANKRSTGRSKEKRSHKNERGNLRTNIDPTPLPSSSDTIEVDGETFAKIDRRYLEDLFGKENPAHPKIMPGKVERWMTHRNPANGERLKLLGYPYSRVNMALIPFIIELDLRLKEAGVQYDFNHISSTNWRPVRGGTTRSVHSWGYGSDFNPGENPVQYLKKGQKMKCSFPPKMVQIMKDVGFTKWGGDWRIPSAKHGGLLYTDPMHWQFGGNAASLRLQRHVLRHPESIAAAKAVDRKVETFDTATRDKWRKLQEDVYASPSTRTPASGRRSPRRTPKERPSTSPGGRFALFKESESAAIHPELRAEVPTILRQAAKYEKVIYETAEKNNIPPELIMALLKTESNYKTNTLSYAGAGGIAQFRPRTARQYGLHVPSGAEKSYTKPKSGRKVYTWLPGDERLNPHLSIRKCGVMLSELLGSVDKRTGRHISKSRWKRTIPEALACYNWGPEAVRQYKAGIRGKYYNMPDQTRHYIDPTSRRGVYATYLAIKKYG